VKEGRLRPWGEGRPADAAPPQGQGTEGTKPNQDRRRRGRDDLSGQNVTDDVGRPTHERHLDDHVVVLLVADEERLIFDADPPL
jgi:hypothetical protein